MYKRQLVDIRVGNGTYICDTPGTKLMDSLLFSFFIANPDTKNLYELRKALEIDVLQLILVHYDENEDDRIALEENLEELSQLIAKGATPEKLQENDLAFHHLLGSCTTNPLLEQIYNIVIDFMEPSITATHKLSLIHIWFPFHRQGSLRNHAPRLSSPWSCDPAL